LENGDRLSAHEFLRRFEAMPELKKAELINGVVYMPSPLRWDRHAKPDSLLQTWAGVYVLNTSGVESGANATVRLGPDDVPQPDACLRILPECGGHTRVDAKGYLQGAPELIVEIAASSASIDARDKLQSYRRAGVIEYLLWRTEDQEIDWWRLDEDEYRLLPRGEEGIIQSQAFPGLWLNIPAALAGDGQRVLGTLQAGLSDPGHAAFVEQLKAKARPTG
jgi:Uma2 family endonuclease